MRHVRDLAALEQMIDCLHRICPGTPSASIVEPAPRGLAGAHAPSDQDFRTWQTAQLTAQASSLPAPPTTQPDLGPWMECIVRYQRMAGSTTSVPKSLRKLFEKSEKLQQELGFLMQHCKRGVGLSEARSHRLEFLRRRESVNGGPHLGRLSRAARDACLAAALDALRTVVAAKADDTWREYVGCPLPEKLQSRRLEFAHWLCRMEVDDAAILRAIVQGWRTWGDVYKAHLPANQAWLKQAAKSGVETSAWLTPPRCETSAEGRPVVISTASDPHDVFLMGNWFGTCLSIARENDMSLLANAHDANKQVVLMRDEAGKVIARQLVTVSQQFKLLGYHCYVAVGREQEERRALHIAAMAEYCGRWARRCELPLGSDDTPATIGEHFWYDDGTHDWHEAALLAGADEQERTMRDLDLVESVLS